MLTTYRVGLFTYATTKSGRERYHKKTFVVTDAKHVADLHKNTKRCED